MIYEVFSLLSVMVIVLTSRYRHPTRKASVTHSPVTFVEYQKLTLDRTPSHKILFKTNILCIGPILLFVFIMATKGKAIIFSR